MIGQTTLRVSEIGFGCGNNAVLMVRGSYEEQLQAVKRALDLGINYFDTAFAYGQGRSEENLGRILNELGAPAVVSTKIRLEPKDATDIKSATIRAVEAGLDRLQMKCVDLIQLHNRITTEGTTGERLSLTPGDIVGKKGVLEGFKEMRRRGRVRYFGFSGLGEAGALHEVVASGQFHSFQVYYNLLNPSAGHAVLPSFTALNYGRIIDQAARQGMGASVIRVLASGALTSSPPLQEEKNPLPMSPGSAYSLDLERAKKVQFLIKGNVKSLTQAAIRFALMKAEISTVLVGFSNMSHIEEAAACSNLGALPPEAMARLRELWDTDFERLK